MICDQDGNATVELLPLESGYWRIDNKSTTVRTCPLDNACGGAAGFYLNGNGYCNEGYMGPLCAVCAVDFYYDPDTRQCAKCERVESPWGLWASSPSLIIFAALGMALFIYFFHVVCSKSSSELDKGRKKAKAMHGKAGDTYEFAQESKVALKSLLAFLQITANIGKFLIGRNEDGGLSLSLTSPTPSVLQVSIAT